jgi:hypothetical protein
MILADQRISGKEIAETLEIPRECVGFVIHYMLDMGKLSAKWVPKCMNVNQKRDCVVASQAILKEHFGWNTPGFLT